MTAERSRGVSAFTVVRDPLWNNIQVDREALDVLDTEPFQRLRYVRQLGHAYLVYPGATHTRFEHALGTYHLARRALAILGERGELHDIHPDDQKLVRLAALLHDVGHYPFSHALEEAGLPPHESMAARHFRHPELAPVLHGLGIDDVMGRLERLIAGTTDNPLGGLISGSLDLDKIEYLTRDARMAGVPYGAVDVDRLLHALSVVTLADGTLAVGVREKGISALESLLFSRYQMYRNVYWHHAVRSATAMFKRLVRAAMAHGDIAPEWIAESTDEALMEHLRARTGGAIGARLRQRRLYKRIAEIRASRLPEGWGDWIASRPELLERVEDRLALELGLQPGDVLLDFPAKAQMLDVDLPLLTAGGTVEVLTGERAVDRLGIQGVADVLHTNARLFRVFSAEGRQVDDRAMRRFLEHTESEIETALDADRPLLDA